MYCLLQLYSTLATELSPYRPLLKFLSIKSVVFLTFWQASLLSVLAAFGAIKDTPTMTSDAIQNGIATILETVEMAIFAIVHLKAFSYMEYKPEHGKGDQRTPRWKSLKHVLDIREFWSELINNSRHFTKTIRGIETDEQARRRLHFSKIMGREREAVSLKGNAEDESDGELFEEYYPESHNLTDANLYDSTHKEKYSDTISNHLRGHGGPTAQPSNRYTSQQLKNTRDGVKDSNIYIQSSSQRISEPNNSRMDIPSLKSIPPREIYNVPLETDLRRSLHGEALPSIDGSRGTVRFLAINRSSRPTSQYLISAGDPVPRNVQPYEQSGRPAMRFSKHRPPRIILPASLAHSDK
ncbi:hypothetical protein Clacol_002655 [Clathrus columnatus]|uniref:Uncharacterized protein n=1 Tax=Clathrus columnatus TaxID=1419009 RepID=A0AAV5A6S4_9AGAM|nr:hypothetical protein Clacol_002655 [Clathrus columnatus]